MRNQLIYLFNTSFKKNIPIMRHLCTIITLSLSILFCLIDLKGQSVERQWNSINGQSMVPKGLQTNGQGQVFSLASTMTGLHSGAVLICSDELGNSIWTLRLELPGGGLTPSSLVLSSNGDLYVVGTVYNPNGQVYIARIDQNGNLLMDQTLDTDFAFLAQKIYEHNGQIFILADIQSNEMGDLWVAAVIQLDEYLNLINSTQLSYHPFTTFHSIAFQADGEIVLTGNTRIAGNDNQALITKMNSNLDIHWTRIGLNANPSYGQTILPESPLGDHRIVVSSQSELFVAHLNSQGSLTAWHWIGNGDSHDCLDIPGVGTFIVSPQNNELILLDYQSNILNRQTWNNYPSQMNTNAVLLDQGSLAVLASSQTYPQEVVFKKSDPNFQPGCLGDTVHYLSRGSEVPFSPISLIDHHLSITPVPNSVRVWLGDPISYLTICGKE
jgi:hypothetical protein